MSVGGQGHLYYDGPTLHPVHGGWQVGYREFFIDRQGDKDEWFEPEFDHEVFPTLNMAESARERLIHGDAI